ncbi:hypothetical protein AAG570_004229, partial [Ranatra chinensis]
IFVLQGTPEQRILLTSAKEPPTTPSSPQLRLVDGPSVLSGRLQVFHNGKWRSVCSNSRRWSRADVDVACREMGWTGGSWSGWIDRESDKKPRLLLQPNCTGTEMRISQCETHPRQMGGPICDYHPDIMIECFPQHDSTSVTDHWRGLRFEYAKYERSLSLVNTFYIPHSVSKLLNVDIRFAGSGKGYNATSALEITGVPPQMSSVTITHSAYNGMNISQPRGPFSVHDSTISNNRGYGIFVNSSDGGVLLEKCTVSENRGDGVRYISHDHWPKNRKDILDLCSLPTTATQTFPIMIALQQSSIIASRKDCNKYFFTRPGYVLTVNFLPILTDRNGSCTVTVRDGISSNDRLLATIPLFNLTKPQSVTSTRNNVFIHFSADSKTETYALIRITSGFDKWTDINITDSTIAENNGTGIVVENLRSRVSVQHTSVSHNAHVGGIRVLSGAGEVNVSDSRIAFNIGDGINITYAGGSTNVSRSTLSSNTGRGLAVWFNETEHRDFVPNKRNTVVQYSEVFRNLETGVLVGNFCGDSIVNITGNWFNSSLDIGVEVKSCLRPHSSKLSLYVGHNRFVQNEKIGLKLRPAVNLAGVIEFNSFSNNSYGSILVKNDPVEEYDILPSDIVIRNNEFYNNRGVYVVNIGLSPYSEEQNLMFTWNFVKDNRIRQPFDDESETKRLIPRSRVAAPVIVSSPNAVVFRNIIQNHDSDYEIGVHFQDQSLMINCTFNWLGYSVEEKIFGRLFDRKDRYNLAKIQYRPYLLHSSNPGTTAIMTFTTYVHQFHSSPSMVVGGEVDGINSLRAGEYTVDRDINVRPGGKLTIEPGVTLRFPPGIGMMVAGKLEARGRGLNDILLTMVDEVEEEPSSTIEAMETETVPPTPAKPTPNVRLIGGATSYEGTLQVLVESQWGTVCNYGWTQRSAALVCSQLGLILNPNDWLLYRSDIPHPGTNDPILLSNVQCTEDDLVLTDCKSEKYPDFENACTHMQDVLMRCYPPHWAGVRLGVLAERSYLQYITIQKAGLLDYATNEFKPALQVDLSRHSLENVRLIENAHDGLGVIYSDIFANGLANTVKNCEFRDNHGSGISFKQVGLKITGSKIENNKVSGIRHNPVLSGTEQREMSGWFKKTSDISTQYDPYVPILVPHANTTVEIQEGETKYIVTQRIVQDSITNIYYIKSTPGFVLGIQLLNPIHNRSTETIEIHDGPDLNSEGERWNVRNDLTVFPATSGSYGIVMIYKSGTNALGMTVFAVSAMRAPKRSVANKVVRLFPTLTILNSRIKGNTRGIWASYYNRHLTELGDHYLRKSNESIQAIGCDISHNKMEAILVDAPYWLVTTSNLSEITIVVNHSLITDNGRGIRQFSRDLRNSTNLFHWNLNDNSIERNSYGGLELSLPYVWDYNENFTHTVRLINNTWRNNRMFTVSVGGHFSHLNISDCLFEENVCRNGLLSVQGMEKQIRISNNVIERNTGMFMVEFKADSQSEILGALFAEFVRNSVKRNRLPTKEALSSVILFDGLQKVRVRRNLISENEQLYSLVAGVRTAVLESNLDVSENWWGSSNASAIKEKIFDFDDWNDHALANFRPYLIEDSFLGSLSISWEQTLPGDPEPPLGGRMMVSRELYARDTPYQVDSDITVMPGATLTIHPGVVIEFAPKVGILVLGTLIAQGARGNEIVMRPTARKINQKFLPLVEQTVRLCTPSNCTGHEGFLERWNSTTQQWVPVCDERFSERNAQVTCRQMMRDTLDIFVAQDRRLDLQHSNTTRIWSWHEPLQCTGEESRLENCEVRLNGQVFGHVHKCNWDSDFVFVHCGPLVGHNNWGGIRFASSEFEQSEFESRVHDVVTHSTVSRSESVMEFVNITGAGLLHSQKSPAVLAIFRSPKIHKVDLTQSVDHGISLIGPTSNIHLLFNRIGNNLGVGVNIASITGEGGESGESSFSPLKDLLIPYRAFSLVDICDPAKEIFVQERIVLYYKYDNRPINCVKILYSTYRIKPFGFRLLQFNLYNSTDRIDLFDGSLYNRSRRHISTLTTNSRPGAEKLFVVSQSPSLSIRLIASAASEAYGFVAEVVTLPLSVLGFNRDVQHNVSYSVLSGNKGGAVRYVSAGEVNPRLTLEYNQFTDNCRKFYGNFTSCKAAVFMDLQNTQNLHFRNNLVRYNQGGMHIKTDSRGSATSLKGWVHNNLFADNWNLPALSVEGRQNSSYQEITIFNNYWTRNLAGFNNIIKLQQVVSNFTYNYLLENTGTHILEVSGFESVKLHQSTSHNGFYWNHATEKDAKSTIVAGTAGQHYVDNIFLNPDNDYELMTVNRSLIDVWQIPVAVNAKHNYWGYNETLAVMGRIKDRSDQGNLLEVDFRPFLMNNASILDKKCPPAWNLVGDTCYIFVGSPMNFHDAKAFCKSVNASMPFVMGQFSDIFKFIKKQQESFQFYYKAWVQHIDKINECTTFVYQRIETDDCERLSPFICEMDPKVIINAMVWRSDIVAIGLIGCVALALLLVGLLAMFWFSKSRHRHVERLERRNSIRQSLHSVRSIGSSHNDVYRKGIAATNAHSSPGLNKSGDYKKMAASLDSIEKSQFNSSNEEDAQSYDIYEAHNPSTTEALNPGFDLSYKNQGFRDNSTFASRDTSAWQSTEDYLHNSSTLPLTSSLAMTDSTADILKPDYQQEPEYQEFYERPKSSAILETNLDESLLPAPPPRAHSETFLETNFDNPFPVQDMSTFQPLSKSQPLETAM